MTQVTLLKSTREVHARFVSAITRAKKIWIASAWASDATTVAKALWAARDRIVALAVGVDFHQTDPAFLERFRRYVRVHLCADGTYHPKIYLFQADDRFEGIVGSSNFTRGGFGANVESNLYLVGDLSEPLFGELVKLVVEFAEGGERLTTAQVEDYRTAFLANRRTVAKAKTYRAPYRAATGWSARLDMPWHEFVAQLARRERYSKHPLFPGKGSIGYIGVIEHVQNIFRDKKRLAAMSVEERRKVAGLEGAFRYFGSMSGAGYFKGCVLSTPEKLDLALDHIPTTGSVSREQFDRFKHALPRPGMGSPGVGSRLLSMKRPDLFICINSENRRKLSEEYNIPKTELTTYDGYWKLLEEVWRCPWFRSPRPEGRERRIWEARVALVDAFYYDG